MSPRRFTFPRGGGGARARVRRGTERRARARRRVSTRRRRRREPSPAPVATLGRGASMDELSARVRSRRSRVRGDDSRRRRSRRFGVFLFIRLLRDDGDGASSRPTTRGFGDPPPPPPPWRATLLAAGVAGALREVAESWVAAWTTRALPGGHRLDSPFSVAAADAFVAVARLANPGDAPTLAPFDVAALARACVAAAALVAPRAARRDEALASILRDGKTGEGGRCRKKTRSSRRRGAAGKSRRRDRRERKRRWRCVS